MIESMQFKNFKVLRDTTLPLSRFTLIVGPNGSGKSTALQALQEVGNPGQLKFHSLLTAGLQPIEENAVEVVLHWGSPYEGVMTKTTWIPNTRSLIHKDSEGTELSNSDVRSLEAKLAGIRIYSLSANAISAPVELEPNMQLSENGANLAGVLDRLRDHEPERFEALNEEFGRWLSEFDRILFNTPRTGHRTFLLRTREGQHHIPATALSRGTLLALTLLTLAYLPDPPPIIGLEEPDRGIHPRLFRRVQDALYRLSHPEASGEQRESVQVVATTHSPYLLDFYRDRPEEKALMGLYYRTDAEALVRFRVTDPGRPSTCPGLALWTSRSAVPCLWTGGRQRRF